MKRLENLLPSLISSILAAILTTGAIAVANYKAVPDTVPRLIPYRGNLDLNGEPYNGSLDMTFGLYHAATAGEAVWTETQNVTVYGGKFSALLGNSNAQSVADLTDVVTGGDDLYLEVSLNGEVLQGRQRFFPAPFALWTTASTDFNVDHDLTVGSDLFVNGTDLKFGPHATRGDGGRALVHYNDDSLVLNFGNDFSGGTKVVGGENDGTNAALKVESGSQRLLMDGNEIDVYTDTNRMLLNNNSLGPVSAGGDLEVAGNVTIGGSVNLAAGTAIDLRNTNQCDCEWVDTNATGSDDSTLWYCPQGKFIRGFDQEKNCGEGDNCMTRVYCCFPCAFQGL